METENLVLNDCSQWQIVKKISEEFPNVCIAILAHTFVVESVNLCDLTALVVTS